MCQRRAWTLHKSECEAIAELRKRKSAYPELKTLAEDPAKWETLNLASIASALVAALDLQQHPTNNRKLALSLDLRYVPGALERGQRFFIEGFRPAPLDHFTPNFPGMRAELERSDEEMIGRGEHGAAIVVLNLGMMPKYGGLGQRWLTIRVNKQCVEYGVVEAGWHKAFFEAVDEGRIFDLNKDVAEVIEKMANTANGEVGRRSRETQHEVERLLQELAETRSRRGAGGRSGRLLDLNDESIILGPTGSEDICTTIDHTTPHT